MNKVVAITTYTRPHYLREVVASLSACNGIGEYTLIIGVDPSSDVEASESIKSIVAGIRFCRCLPVFNRTRMGINENTLRVLTMGFQISDYVVYLDEDVVLGPDAMRYFEYCGNKFRDDPTVFNVTALCNRQCDSTEEYLGIERRQWFTPGGFATWVNRWDGQDGICRNWKSEESWDVKVNKKTRGNRHEIYPLLSRSKNIGVIGEHTPSQEFFNKYCLIQSWSGDRTWKDYAKTNAGKWITK